MAKKDAAPAPPPEVAPEAVYQAVWNDVCNLMAIRRLLRQLFGSPERTSLLNAAAPDVFVHVQRLFTRELILGAARLIEGDSGPNHKKKYNLGLHRLVEAADRLQKPDLKAVLEADLSNLERMLSPMEPIRHKQIAHRDLAHALASATEPLPRITVAQIDALVDAIHSFVNRFAIATGRGPLANYILFDRRGANALIDLLAKAQADDNEHRSTRARAMQRLIDGAPGMTSMDIPPLPRAPETPKHPAEVDLPE